MSKQRPIPPVEGMGARVERGVGPVARQAAEPPAAGVVDEQAEASADELPGPAAPGPVAAPDGTFSSAKNPASAELVPAGPAAAAAVDAPPAVEEPREEPQQGPVYTFSRPEVPRAEEILQPRPKIEREQISHMVPAELRLVQRMRLYWATEGIEQRDQVAFALDQWLRARGF